MAHQYGSTMTVEHAKRAIRDHVTKSNPGRHGSSSGIPLETIAIPVSLTSLILVIAFIAVVCARRFKNRVAQTETYTIQRKVCYEADSDSENESGMSHGVKDDAGIPAARDSPNTSPVKLLPRQATVPLLPQRVRQEAFKRQRQLSLQLNLANVEFSVKNVHRKEQPKLGALRPELYRDSSQDRGKDSDRCGKLYFSLQYDHPTESLNVHIDRATGLPAKDFSGTSDPYVKIHLFPADRKKKYQTKVHRKNCDPDFDEKFTFTVPYNELQEKTLKFTVYDFDRFSRHDLIGEVMITNLLGNDRDLVKGERFEEDVVKCSTQEKADLGEVMFSLCYLPTACRLTLTVIKARNLKAMDITGASDPYVKVSMVCQGKRVKKKKTTVKKNTLNPVYNEAMVFDIVPESMDNILFVVAVVDYDWVGHSELIGVCEVGPNSLGQGKDHWEEMLGSPRKQIAHWYQLQESTPSLSAASISSTMKGCMTPQQSVE
ncbi:synaptotagmin-10-like [Asterias amurensis]|uniref:synaptotagmin-10-like n=1 Tax=Asterias amurensis TaxID=7602 RepID=UPI003AB184BB